MKRSFLLSAMLCLALALCAQSQERLKLSDLALHPELVTPEIAYTLSKQRPDAEGYLPPIVAGPYNLRDSFYNYSWSAGLGAWEEKTKTYETRDCDAGHLLSVLVRGKDLNTGLFVNKTLSTYGWYPNGKNQYFFRYTWDDDMPNGWVQTLFDTTDQEGKGLENWSKSWNTTDNIYSSGGKDVNIYDANGNLTVTHGFALEPSTDTWLATKNITYSYSNGNIASIVTEAFDANLNAWAPTDRRENTYNGLGQLVSTLTQLYDGTDWINDRRYNYTYNSAGLLEEYIAQLYDSGNWLNTNRTTSAYYPSNANKQTLTYNWSDLLQHWVETGRDSISESGNVLFRINKFYDAADNDFFSGIYFVYTYNNSGLLIQTKLNQLVPGTQNDWSNLSLTTYSYDANDQVQEVVGQSWDATAQEYVNLTRTYNFNTGCLFNSASTEEAKQAACFHSNPIKLGQPIHCTSFDSNEELSLSLYSMTGTLVSSGDFRSGDALSARAGVGPGMYVVSITNKKGEAYRAKLVVVE